MRSCSADADENKNWGIFCRSPYFLLSIWWGNKEKKIIIRNLVFPKVLPATPLNFNCNFIIVVGIFKSNFVRKNPMGSSKHVFLIVTLLQLWNHLGLKMWVQMCLLHYKIWFFILAVIVLTEFHGNMAFLNFSAAKSWCQLKLLKKKSFIFYL